MSKISIGKLNRFIDENIDAMNEADRNCDLYFAWRSQKIAKEMRDACDAIHEGTDKMYRFMQSQRDIADGIRGVIKSWDNLPDEDDEDCRFALVQALESMDEMIALSQWLVEHPGDPVEPIEFDDAIPSIY